MKATTLQTEIAIDKLADGGVIGLLALHREEMFRYSPPESIHALDESALHAPEMTFWSARQAGEVVAFGALKALSPVAGEIKSMKTRPGFLRQGLGARLLESILAEAGRRGYHAVSLETGTHAAFDPAVALYQRFGFVPCPPFADYAPDPYSRFYTKRLGAGQSLAGSEQG